MTARRFKGGETVDFIVVGSGAAGGVIARELSAAGSSVLVFEQGPRFGPADFAHDELKYFFLNGITLDPALSPQSFRKTTDAVAKVPLGPSPAQYARLVGGSSNHYTANFWRFHEIDFHERSVLGSISG
ncbi:MAG TPA: NAD(P)-binding protein, partial [Steroidobacteraceae bacterium]